MGAPSVASIEEVCPGCVQESAERDSLEKGDILEDPLQDSESEGPSEDDSEESELGDDVTIVPGSALDAGDGPEGEGDVPSGDPVLEDDCV